MASIAALNLILRVLIVARNPAQKGGFLWAVSGCAVHDQAAACSVHELGQKWMPLFRQTRISLSYSILGPNLPML